jgi:hypothetical protein
VYAVRRKYPSFTGTGNAFSNGSLLRKIQYSIFSGGVWSSVAGSQVIRTSVGEMGCTDFMPAKTGGVVSLIFFADLAGEPDEPEPVAAFCDSASPEPARIGLSPRLLSMLPLLGSDFALLMGSESAVGLVPEVLLFVTLEPTWSVEAAGGGAEARPPQVGKALSSIRKSATKTGKLPPLAVRSGES